MLLYLTTLANYSYICVGVIEGKTKGGIEVIGRRGKRRRKLLDDLKERRGYSHLKEESLDRTMWRARFGRGFGPVVRQTTKWMNECALVISDLLSTKPLLIICIKGKTDLSKCPSPTLLTANNLLLV